MTKNLTTAKKANRTKRDKLVNYKSGIAFAILVMLSVFASACLRQTPPENANGQATPANEKSAAITPTPEEDITKFERELRAMRVAGFDYIFALKRKDGQAFTSEDRQFVRENKHYAANRFTFIEEEKILFVGSNYEFSEDNINALKERFEFQDFSKPKEQIEKEKQEKLEEAEKANKAKEKAENSNSQQP